MSEQTTRQDLRPLARYAAVVLSSGEVIIFLLLVSLLVPAAGQLPGVWDSERIAAAITLAYFLVLQVILLPLISKLYKF
jgi:Na+/phosphate symporter